MLVNPVTSALFQEVSGEFVVRKGITIPSLTEAAFRRILGEVLSVINNVSQLRTFLREVEADTHITRTFEAYGESVSLILEAFSYQVLKIETIVKKQEETKTMIDVIESLQPWFKMIDSFKRLHDKASSEWKTNQNWLKSVKLLRTSVELPVVMQLSDTYVLVPISSPFLWLIPSELQASFYNWIVAFDEIWEAVSFTATD